jgi:hypothetical protein
MPSYMHSHAHTYPYTHTHSHSLTYTLTYTLPHTHSHSETAGVKSLAQFMQLGKTDRSVALGDTHGKTGSGE